MASRQSRSGRRSLSPPTRSREKKSITEQDRRREREKYSLHAIRIVEETIYDLSLAIARIKQLLEGVLSVIVKYKCTKGRTQVDIILRNPEKNDRLHGHIAVKVDKFGRSSLACAPRAYNKERRIPHFA